MQVWTTFAWVVSVNLAAWWRRLWKAPQTLPESPRTVDLAGQVDQLTVRIRTLEAERLELLTEWTKTRDQVLRYMKRAGALKPKAPELPDLELDEEPEEEPTVPDLDLFRAKFR